eukprot:comp15880_c1_seq1/m.13227 comp15880_c1_seq1/g.13227  ORF comp15880_c1_seq1/g.13227 comp15880_c1_seq1/m.13227 type:complete len:328 (-) comp15880_c1_seq1:7-990(-)
MAAKKSELHILPNRVRIASIQRQDLPLLTHYLLRPFVHNTYETAFFSFTRTATEVSLVFDASVDVPFIPQLSIWPNEWRVLNVAAGQMGGETCELVSNLTQPLATAGISVFYLSTYQTDFLLVQDKQLNQALSTLASTFDLVDSSTQEEFTIPPQQQQQQHITNSEVDQSNETGNHPSTNTRPLRLLSHRLYITSIRTTLSTEQLRSCVLWPLLDLMFYEDSAFFSITMVEGDVSVVADEACLSKLPPHAVNMASTCWRILQVDADEGLGYEEVGIVVKYAQPLVERARLSIYYISTYDTDHVLVEEDDLDSALEAFGTANITIIEQ